MDGPGCSIPRPSQRLPLTMTGGGGGLTSACCREGSAVDIPAVQLVHEVGMNPNKAQLEDPEAIPTEAGSSIDMWPPIDTICTQEEEEGWTV